MSISILIASIVYRRLTSHSHERFQTMPRPLTNTRTETRSKKAARLKKVTVHNFYATLGLWADFLSEPIERLDLIKISMAAQHTVKTSPHLFTSLVVNGKSLKNPNLVDGLVLSRMLELGGSCMQSFTLSSMTMRYRHTGN